MNNKREELGKAAFRALFFCAHEKSLLLTHRQEQANWVGLKFHNVLRLRTALALYDIKLYTLAFIQRFEAFTLDGREVDKHILAALSFDKAKPFFPR